jgi:hypothetical protein
MGRKEEQLFSFESRRAERRAVQFQVESEPIDIQLQMLLFGIKQEAIPPSILFRGSHLKNQCRRYEQCRHPQGRPVDREAK